MSERKYQVSYRYYHNGVCVRGGEWEFTADSDENALQQFYDTFAKAEPNYRDYDLSVNPPELMVGNETEVYLVDQLATLTDEDLELLIRKVRTVRNAE